MEYQVTSLKEVIGRVIRNTRVADSSFIIDLPEWLAEAMGQIRSRVRTVPAARDVHVRFNRARIPGEALRLTGVEHGGQRLPYSKDGGPARSSGYELTTAVSSPYLPRVGQSMDEDGKLLYSGSFQPLEVLPACHSGEWYNAELGHVTLSFRDGLVRLHYRMLPLDGEGYPLIVDNEAYKQALYWYCRMMMIGAGYPDKEMNFTGAEARWDRYRVTAKQQLRTLSVDQTDELCNQLTRLHLPSSFASDRYY